jgi:hypothetical protein
VGRTAIVDDRPKKVDVRVVAASLLHHREQVAAFFCQRRLTTRFSGC